MGKESHVSSGLTHHFSACLKNYIKLNRLLSGAEREQRNSRSAHYFHSAQAQHFKPSVHPLIFWDQSAI